MNQQQATRLKTYDVVKVLLASDMALTCDQLSWRQCCELPAWLGYAEDYKMQYFYCIAGLYYADEVNRCIMREKLQPLFDMVGRDIVKRIAQAAVHTDYDTTELHSVNVVDQTLFDGDYAETSTLLMNTALSILYAHHDDEITRDHLKADYNDNDLYYPLVKQSEYSDILNQATVLVELASHAAASGTA